MKACRSERWAERESSIIFPLDAEYVFQAKLYRTNLNIVRGLESPHDVEFTVDGQRVHIAMIGGKEDLEALVPKTDRDRRRCGGALEVSRSRESRTPRRDGGIRAGIQAAHPGRLQRYIRSSVDNFDWSGQPHIQMLSITGPFDNTGSGDTPSRRRIFICRPSGAANETACARQIISTLARRAFRRPLTAVDEQRIFGFYETTRRERGFEAGIEAAVQRILASPQFILRIERDPAQGVIHAGHGRGTRFAAVLLFLEQYSR